MSEFSELLAGAVRAFGCCVEEHAGTEIRHKVMQGVEPVTGTTGPVKGALDYKLAIERLDELTDKATCEKIMTACGRTCQSIFDQGILKIKELRQQYATEEEFLENLPQLDSRTTLERRGNDIIQRFRPGKEDPGLRCECLLMRGLPKGTYASRTICECPRGFTEQRWETILGRPVRAEIISTPLTDDTDECTVVIHL